MQTSTGPQEKQRRHGPSPEEAALLDLLRTTDMLSRRLLQVLKTEDLSALNTTCCAFFAARPKGSPAGKLPTA